MSLIMKNEPLVRTDISFQAPTQVKFGVGKVAALADEMQIEDDLGTAAIVPSRRVSPDIVTMYSQILLMDLETHQRHKLTLCYPADAEPAAGFVSVLSPAGWSVLGLSVGSIARWRTPAGDERAGAILAILFQPEASGDYSV